jgi:Protein of unknown function (Hypoth_ymh)
MSKLARKLRKKVPAINVMVSKKAGKLGISAEAALILLAKEHGIGTAIYQRGLDSSKQAEVRIALPTVFAPSTRSKGNGRSRKTGEGRKSTISASTSLRLTIEYLIQDPVLLGRCRDILMARANFDRPINQATVVLEDRIRTKAQPPQRMVGEKLVSYAFNEDIARTVLRVASNDPDDQRGFTQILRGVVPAFRNKTHHHIVDSFSREEALRVVGFIDILLRVVDNSVKVEPKAGS